MPDETLAVHSAQILGNDLRGKSDAGQGLPFEIDGVSPRFLVRADSAKQVCEVIRCAGAERLAIIASSGRSKLAMGGTPSRYDIALDVNAMNRIISYDPGDLTLSVEPGCTLGAVNTALAEHGQFLPLAGPWRERASIGGTIASGIDGPWRQRYGTARDFVLGMEFITGDGKAAKSGGRVVKNVTGYEMHKLMIGAYGTLGVLTRINFRTFPVPVGIAAMVALFDSVAQAVQLRHHIEKSALSPLTLDVMHTEVLRKHASRGRGWRVIASFAGIGAVKARYERELTEMAQESGAKDVRMVTANEWDESFGEVCDFIPQVIQAFPSAVIMKLGVLPHQIAAACERGVGCAESSGLRWAVLARGVGVIYFALLMENENEHSKECLMRATGQIAEAVAELDGHYTIPWLPSGLKSSLRIWGAPRTDLTLMQKVKSIFDPVGILSPGRFVGGI